MNEATSRFDYDLFVIGAGSGGVRAARISAGYGAKVAMAEEHRVGGTCVIRGCVPKKLLIYAAHFSDDLSSASQFGWDVGEPVFRWEKLRDRVSSEVSRLEGLYAENLNRNSVQVFKERAVIVGPHLVRLASGRELSAGKILIATGARPVRPQFPGAEFAITSNEVFELATLPRRIVIVGGGYIANEFAGMFHSFGVSTTVLNRGSSILRGYDEQITSRLLEVGKHKGIDFRFGVQIEKIMQLPNGSLQVDLNDGVQLSADQVLFATGRIPNVEGLGLAETGIALNERGAIKVDADNQSSINGIYAVGDVTDRVQLTPVAIREGHAFADSVFGNKPTRVDYDCIPSAVFSSPPIAAVGLTEASAKTKFAEVRTYVADFRPMKNVLAERNERALYKMIVDAASNVVVGLHMIGPDAPEILQAAAVAVKAKLTKAAFDETIALHPSMAEELVLFK
jgi:glutathione reductase (NADPH)